MIRDLGYITSQITIIPIRKVGEGGGVSYMFLLIWTVFILSLEFNPEKKYRKIIFLYLISRKSRFSTPAPSNINNILNFFQTVSFISLERSLNQKSIRTELRKLSVRSKIDKNKNDNAFRVNS